MQARMKNPAMIVPDAMQGSASARRSAEQSGLPARTLGLVHLRASQINGCSVCVDTHPRLLKKTGETEERLFAVAAWRDAPYFTDAERAALGLTEAATRHYDERTRAVLIIAIATINVWNRLNVSTRQVAGEWVKSAEAQNWMESHSASR
jgi:AhpD family alkylhydroperoxidase